LHFYSFSNSSIRGIIRQTWTIMTSLILPVFAVRGAIVFMAYYLAVKYKLQGRQP